MSAKHKQGRARANVRLRSPAGLATILVLAFVIPVCARNADQDPGVLLQNGKAAIEDGQFALAEKQFRTGLARARKGSPEAA